jgi:4-amino-4-deoxy-L-arabinose transferase-like glycosyltransferase
VTSFFDGIIAGLVSLVLNVWITAVIRSRTVGWEGTFLVKTYWYTLLLRHAIALFLNAFAGDMVFAAAFWGDSSTYDWGGRLLSLQWSGTAYMNPLRADSVSGFGFTYFVGAVYYVFGQNQLLVQFLNATLGSLSVVVIYATARLLFDARVARWAALFMAFFPQMVFWSCAMYKDPAVLLCIAMSMYATLRLKSRFSFGYLVLYLAAVLALMTLRFYVFYMVVIATLGTFVFSQRRGFVSGLFGQVVLVLAFSGAMFLGVRSETVRQQQDYLSLERMQVARADQANLARSGYGAEIDVSTPTGAVAALPIGLVYMLLAPFPWSASGMRQLLTVPEMLVWYSLLPALARGLRHTVRERLGPTLPILVFALLLTVSYAVFQSNVGTVYRQRTQISMFFFIFMGLGLELRKKARTQGPAAGRTP